MNEKIVPVLRVRSAAKAGEWYRRLGFAVTGEHRFEPGMPAYAFLQRGEERLHLSEHAGDAKPHGLVYMYVEEVDGIAREFGVEISEQPWGMREVWLTDPDGNRWRIGCPSKQ